MAEAILLLTSESEMQQKSLFNALLTKLAQLTDSNDGNRVTFLPNISRFMTLLQQHDDVSAVKGAMTFLGYLCRNDECKAAMGSYIEYIVAQLTVYLSTTEVLFAFIMPQCIIF